MIFYKTLRINKIYEYKGVYKVYGYAIHEGLTYIITVFKKSNVDISLLKEGESSRLGLEPNRTSDWKSDGEHVILREIKQWQTNNTI